MSGVIIDTSIWVDHFRNGNSSLVELVEADLALHHPMVTAELACGMLPGPRVQTLRNFTFLRACNQATLQEVINFTEQQRLYGRGCGLIDLCLLASTMITAGARLWTLDKRLANLARAFAADYQPAVH